MRSGKGGKRCNVGMERWGWQIEPWLDYRIINTVLACPAPMLPASAGLR